MKQLVREYLDLVNTNYEDHSEMLKAYGRVDEIEKELKELSGYED